MGTWIAMCIFKKFSLDKVLNSLFKFRIEFGQKCKHSSDRLRSSLTLKETTKCFYLMYIGVMSDNLLRSSISSVIYYSSISTAINKNNLSALYVKNAVFALIGISGS